MSDRLDHLTGWAATTKQVESVMFKELAEKYVFDEDTRRRIMKENPWALNNMLRRLMEANQRGFWQATEEELEKLKQIYLELEGELEEQEI